MSKLIDSGVQVSSRNPRMNVYLPPESLQVPACCSEKTDCFSFGVLVIQILSGHFPLPADKSMATTEVGRRQNHIGMIDEKHPLLSIALCCLSDNASDRPFSQQLCDRIASVKDKDYTDVIHPHPEEDFTFAFEESRIAGSKGVEEVFRLSMESQLEQKEKIIATLRQGIVDLEQQLEEFRRTHSKELAKKNWMITESEIRLRTVNEKLEKSEEARALLERQTLAFETWAQQPLASAVIDSKRKIRLEHGEEISPPFIHDFSRFCGNAIVNGDMVFFKTALSPEICAFDSVENSWSPVPTCPHINGYCSIVIVNDLLTTVGDYDYGDQYSNRLYSFMSVNRWRKAFPNMLTKRCLATTLCTGTALIVAGGRGEDRRVKQTVEIMNTKSCRWFTAEDLPEPLFCSSATVCGERVYLAGGKDKYSLSTPAVYTCSLSALLKSCQLRLLRSHHPLLPDPISLDQESAGRPSIWTRLADLPVLGSTLVSVNGQLLSVGGRELNHNATTSILVFDSSANSWLHLDHRMSTPRSECFAAVLPDNRLMIAGGYTAAGNIASTVEIATVS